MNFKEQLLLELSQQDFEEIELVTYSNGEYIKRILSGSKEKIINYLSQMSDDGMLGEYQITGWEINQY